MKRTRFLTYLSSSNLSRFLLLRAAGTPEDDGSMPPAPPTTIAAAEEEVYAAAGRWYSFLAFANRTETTLWTAPTHSKSNKAGDGSRREPPFSGSRCRGAVAVKTREPGPWKRAWPPNPWQRLGVGARAVKIAFFRERRRREDLGAGAVKKGPASNLWNKGNWEFVTIKT